MHVIRLLFLLVFWFDLISAVVVLFEFGVCCLADCTLFFV